MSGRLWKKFVNRESVTYVIVGVLTTAVDWVTYTVLRHMEVDYRVATALGWAAAVLFAFVANKLLVFRSFGMSPGRLWKEFSGFVTARVATGLFTMVAMVVMVDGLHWNEYFGKVMVSVISLVLNYIFSKWFIFKKTDGKLPERAAGGKMTGSTEPGRKGVGSGERRDGNG